MDFEFVSFFVPGDKHELHPTKQINMLGKSVSTPSIVVHVAEDGAVVGATTAHGSSLATAGGAGAGVRQNSIPTITFGAAPPSAIGKKIKPTRCPDRQTSLD